MAVKTCRPSLKPCRREPVRARRARFELEARALSEISDEAIVGYVEHGTTERGEPFLVMDWVEGESLTERLAGAGLTVGESFALGGDLARALQVIHQRGIIHRDLKPANLMLRGGDVRRVVLVDFGVARRAENVSVTLSGARVGTLLYMAPEQIRDPRRVDGRADVFALGCVLFECLTGARAFEPRMRWPPSPNFVDDAPDPRELRAELEEDAAACAQLLAEIGKRGLRPTASSSGGWRRSPSELVDGLGAPARRARPSSVPRALLPPRLHRRGVRPRSAVANEQIGPSSAARRPAIARYTNRFIGREGELSHLTALVRSGAALVTVWGPAGIGKTRLTRELARRGGQGKLELVELVDLGQARDLDDALRLVVRCIAASLRGNESAEQMIGRALGRLGPCVLIVDRVEHLARELGPSELCGARRPASASCLRRVSVYASKAPSRWSWGRSPSQARRIASRQTPNRCRPRACCSQNGCARLPRATSSAPGNFAAWRRRRSRSMAYRWPSSSLQHA